MGAALGPSSPAARLQSPAGQGSAYLTFAFSLRKCHRGCLSRWLKPLVREPESGHCSSFSPSRPQKKSPGGFRTCPAACAPLPFCFRSAPRKWRVQERRQVGGRKGLMTDEGSSAAGTFSHFPSVPYLPAPPPAPGAPARLRRRKLRPQSVGWA